MTDTRRTPLRLSSMRAQVETDPDTIIVTVDDDVFYHPDTVGDVAEELALDPKHPAVRRIAACSAPGPTVARAAAAAPACKPHHLHTSRRGSSATGG